MSCNERNDAKPAEEVADAVGHEPGSAGEFWEEASAGGTLEPGPSSVE